MESPPIDGLARILATRRASLGFLTAVGLLAFGASSDDAAAKNGRKRRRRKRKQRRPEESGQPPAPEPTPERAGIRPAARTGAAGHPVSGARGDLHCQSAIALLRRSRLRSNGCRDGLLPAGGDAMRVGRRLLLRDLRLPRRGRHLCPVSRAHMQRHTTLLWRPDVYEWLLRRLPRPRDLLHQQQPVLLQRLHERGLPLRAGRSMCARRRLPRLLSRAYLHECLREWGLRGLRLGAGCPASASRP